MGIERMTDNSLKTQAFKLKGRFYTLTVLQLLSTDVDDIDQQLSEVVASAPKLFDRTPMVLDCSAITLERFDLQTVCQRMRLRGMVPVALQGGDALLNTLAQVQGLAVLHTANHAEKQKNEPAETILEVTTESVEQNKTKVFTAPIRSGQQVVSKGGDLIVTAAVSHGAELLADGHIHVYGALRGRALAGIAGDKQARIFCQSLDAELVSIAGFYRLREAIEPYNKPCQIFLQEDHIQIEPL